MQEKLSYPNRDLAVIALVLPDTAKIFNIGPHPNMAFHQHQS